MEISFSFESGSSHGKVWSTWRFLLCSTSSASSSKKVIITLKNDDDECFKWAITRALNPVENQPERIDRELRETSEVLNWEGLKFPVNFSDINKFENHNSSISVNVFGYEKLGYPLTISKYNYKRESTVNLLLISDDDTKQH